MKKDNTSSLIIVGVIVIVVVLIYGGKQGWFTGLISIGSSDVNVNMPENTNPDNFNNQYAPYNVVLSFLPVSICSGQSTTGSIDSNIGNGICSIFIKTSFNPTWQLFNTVTLNPSGDYSASQVVNTVGTANFAAICCDYQKNCRISNVATLIVDLCNNPTPTPDTSNCFDSDYGRDIYTLGICESEITMTGVQDTCASLTSVYEKFCDYDGTCGSEAINCPTGWFCINGICSQPACSGIIYPTSQASCDVGYCSSGGCMFHPATLTTQAYCSCI